MKTDKRQKHVWFIDFAGVLRKHYEKATESQMILSKARLYAEFYPTESTRIYKAAKQGEYQLVATVNDGKIKLASEVKLDDQETIDYARTQEPWKSLITS